MDAKQEKIIKAISEVEAGVFDIEKDIWGAWERWIYVLSHLNSSLAQILLKKFKENREEIFKTHKKKNRALEYNQVEIKELCVLACAYKYLEDKEKSQKLLQQALNKTAKISEEQQCLKSQVYIVDKLSKVRGKIWALQVLVEVLRSKNNLLDNKAKSEYLRDILQIIKEHSFMQKKAQLIMKVLDHAKKHPGLAPFSEIFDFVCDSNNALPPENKVYILQYAIQNLNFEGYSGMKILCLISESLAKFPYFPGREKLFVMLYQQLSHVKDSRSHCFQTLNQAYSELTVEEQKILLPYLEKALKKYKQHLDTPCLAVALALIGELEEAYALSQKAYDISSGDRLRIQLACCLLHENKESWTLQIIEEYLRNDSLAFQIILQNICKQPDIKKYKCFVEKLEKYCLPSWTSVIIDFAKIWIKIGETNKASEWIQKSMQRFRLVPYSLADFIIQETELPGRTEYIRTLLHELPLATSWEIHEHQQCLQNLLESDIHNFSDDLLTIFESNHQKQEESCLFIWIKTLLPLILQKSPKFSIVEIIEKQKSPNKELLKIAYSFELAKTGELETASKTLYGAVNDLCFAKH